MPRKVNEWIGKTDDSRPSKHCLLRLFDTSGGVCAGCGSKVGPKGWEADHIVRLKDGGDNRESNLQVLCKPCHRAKTGEENALQGKANRIRLRAIGAPKRKSKLSKPEGMRYNWQTGRYERDE